MDSVRARTIPAVAVARNTLLRVGAPEWETINREESRERIAWARERTVEELVAAGTALSRTAHQILATVGSTAPRDAGTT